MCNINDAKYRNLVLALSNASKNKQSSVVEYEI